MITENMIYNYSDNKDNDDNKNSDNNNVFRYYWY